MKHLFFVFFIIVFIAHCSQDEVTKPEALGAIKGKITDALNSQPIKDAEIQTEPPTIFAISDSSGDYEISDIAPGEYIVKAVKVCYEVSSVKVTALSGESTACDIPLNKLAYSYTWDMSKEYSITNNPNGVWSYGRKWSPEGKEFDLMTVRWGDSGWYLGNWGHGGPSIQSGPNLWAKNNSNGLPVVRWTTPVDGYYNFSCKFTGVDSRGVDVIAYVTLNDSVVFNNHIEGYHGSSNFSLDFLNLQKDDHIDFLIKWNGGVYSEYSWTIVDGVVNKYKEQ